MDGQKCDEKEKTQSLKRLEIVYLYLCESSPLGYQTVSSQVVDVYCVARVRDKELRRRGNTLFDCKDSKQKAISHFAYFIFLSVSNIKFYYSLAKTLTLGRIKKTKKHRSVVTLCRGCTMGTLRSSDTEKTSASR